MPSRESRTHVLKFLARTLSNTVILFSKTKFWPELKIQLIVCMLHAYTLYTWAEFVMGRLCYVPSLFGWSYLVNIVYYSWLL